MTLLDAYALVAFLAGEKAAPGVERLLRAGAPAMTAVNLAETIDVLVRVRGHALPEVETRLVPLLATTIRVVPVGESEARLAAAARAKHYHRRTAPLSLADCFLLAAALAQRAAIATSDPPLARAARAEGVTVVPLPDSAGSVP